MTIRFNFFMLAAALLLLASCTSSRKTTGLNYLENMSDTAIRSGVKVSEPVIQKNDLLSITVYSASINPAVDAPYNLPQTGQAGTGGGSGFLVDANGNIEYPRLGTIKAEGLTKSALAGLIKSKLEGTQLTSPTVLIRFLNYRITVLGEVNNPGTYNVPMERVNILEALGMAGDVSEFGKRNTVKVLREKDGFQYTAMIDLTSKDMFQSPYFMLQQNDVVFVEQLAEKRQSRNRQNAAQQIGIVISIVTAVALILNFIK